MQVLGRKVYIFCRAISRSAERRNDMMNLANVGKDALKRRSRSMVEIMRQRIEIDPKTVPPLWRDYLYMNYVMWGSVDLSLIMSPSSSEVAGERELLLLFLYDQMKILSIIDTYQHQGHVGACLDPLNIVRPEKVPPDELLPGKTSYYHKKILVNRKKRVATPDNTFICGYGEVLTVDETIRRLNRSYSASIGYEYIHIWSHSVCQWLRKYIESPDICPGDLPKAEKKKLLTSLLKAEYMEKFTEEKYPAHSKHTLGGFLMLIPALRFVVDAASDYGAEAFVIGMNSAKGRMNILANVLRKPLMKLFEPFGEAREHDRYLLGTHVKRVTRTGRSIEFALVPSTPEFTSIDCEVMGKARVEQHNKKDTMGLKVWPIIIHDGDVLKESGLTYQAIRLSMMRRFQVRGTMHFVLSNQSELSDDTDSADSAQYCTNIAYTCGAPVFHANSHDPESVIFAVSLATEYRAKFQSDVFVNLVGYEKPDLDRKQLPEEFIKRMDAMQSIASKYLDFLIETGVVTRGEADVTRLNYMEKVSNEYERARLLEFHPSNWITSRWKKFFGRGQQKVMPETGLTEEKLNEIIDGFANYTPSVPVRQSYNHWGERIDLAKQKRINWYMAESLVFASLLEAGFHVRLSGQDCHLNLYNERHQLLYSSENNITEVPLQAMYGGLRNKFVLAGTHLAEEASLSFLAAYSQSSPRCLVIWESVPSDMISRVLHICDKFLATGQKRWIRQCGIVLILAHGLYVDEAFCDAKPAAFLQQCNSESPYWRSQTMVERLRVCNWVVTNVTTPANYFHLLRRHSLVNFRKPILLFNHRQIFNNPEVLSNLNDFVEGSSFQYYITDGSIKVPQKVARVLFCCGTIYYHLLRERAARKLEGDVAICRLEQLYPFPYQEVRDDILKFGAAKMFWVQLESINLGWWAFFQECFYLALLGNPLKLEHRIDTTLGYMGPSRAAPAFYPPKNQDIYRNVIRQALDLQSTGDYYSHPLPTPETQADKTTIPQPTP